MSLDPVLLRGVVTAVTLAGIDGACGREDVALEDAESALRMLQCAIQDERARRDLVRRLVEGCENPLSHDRDTRPSDDGEAREVQP